MQTHYVQQTYTAHPSLVIVHTFVEILEHLAVETMLLDVFYDGGSLCYIYGEWRWSLYRIALIICRGVNQAVIICLLS